MTMPAMAVSPRRPAERWADLCILVCGLLLGAAGAIALLVATIARRDTRLLIGVAIYAVGLLAMLGSSLAYHAAAGPPRRGLLRRFDHAAIFAMIAGTVDTVCAQPQRRSLGFAMTAAVWAAAAIGIVVKLRLPIGGQAIGNPLSDPRLGQRCRARAVGLARYGTAARRRRRPIYSRRHVLSLASTAVSQRDLARLCPGRGSLPLLSDSRRRRYGMRPMLAADRDQSVERK